MDKVRSSNIDQLKKYITDAGVPCNGYQRNALLHLCVRERGVYEPPEADDGIVND